MRSVPSVLLIIVLAPAFAGEELREEAAGEIVVTVDRQAVERLQVPGSIARLDRDVIEDDAARHIAELIERVPGAWIVRGSGQEHQTAIRSPVLGGGGACGGFLLLEDGIPVRPAGFCNINQFIELATELAQAVEVVRGPGNALYGSNALHGTVNSVMPMPGAAPFFAVEAGADDFYRASGLWDGGEAAPWLASFVFSDDGGWRDASGYRQGKLHAKHEASWMGGQGVLAFTATDLDQDTAGFITGFDAYEDESLARTNPDAGAFRDADSQRLYALWNGTLNGF
ncbi:MAG: TonB-dependent receptor plug domain-containing protein, partial [Xanthomonadales bacterium]|nr:TonB-dependent receptor plug domain-containing protein [Xanthomonadales bacterium]